MSETVIHGRNYFQQQKIKQICRWYFINNDETNSK